MKKAFTMIELIFVIVILGILAAVALPKFLGVSQQAHEANLKDFTGTLNRTIGASLWSKSLSEGNNGKISVYSSDYDGANFKTLSDIPKEVDSSTIKLENCNSGSFDYNKSGAFAKADSSVTGKDYYIFCRDGNATTPPAFDLVTNTGKVIAGPDAQTTVTLSQ